MPGVRWALAATMAVGVAASGTSAQADVAARPLEASAPAIAIANARAERTLHDVTRDVAFSQQEVFSDQASLNVTTGELQVNSAQLTAVSSRVKARVLLAYTSAGTETSNVLNVGDAQELNAARHYLSATNVVDVSELTQLKQAQDFLEREKTQKSDALQHATAKLAELTARRQSLAQAVKDGRAKLDAMGAIPVMGDAILNAGELASWYRSTGAVPHLAPGTTIDDVAQLYISEGAAEGVRGDIAFAQSVIETAGFSVAAGNNFSGIGVCDSCTGGFSFPTPRDGVRAQMQLLRSYADPDSRASNLAAPPSPGIWGSDPVKAAHLYDTFFLKGKAPLWNQMGSGNWATDPTYAGKVIGLFNQMVAYANGQH